MWGVNWSLVNSPHKGQWCGALMFSLISTWTNRWVNNRDAADLRCHWAHHDVTVPEHLQTQCPQCHGWFPQACLYIYLSECALSVNYSQNSQHLQWLYGMSRTCKWGEMWEILYILNLTMICKNQHLLKWLQEGWLLQWCHNEHDGISNDRHLGCLLNRLFRRRSKKI